MFDPATITVADIDRIETALGRPLDTKLSAADLLTVLAELGVDDPRSYTLEQAREFFDFPDTMPTVYENGVPSEGGTSADRWIVVCALRFNWPPDVTRRQTLRDLRLLVESQED